MPRPQYPLNLANVLLFLGALVLAYEPFRWLLGTWYHQGYSGIGWFAFALVALCMLWSWSSKKVIQHAPSGRTYWLLLCTALLRLLSQVLDINVVGALLLAVDVYAVANLAGLSHRVRAISPAALALLFCFCLPLEPMVQRLVGYDLQRISAWLACGMLSGLFADLSCAGVRLQVDGHDVLVDLPCSGAQLLSILGMLAALLCTLRPIVPRHYGQVLTAFLMIGVATNALRITLLAIGISQQDSWHIDVMAPVVHTAIGLVTVAVACCLLLWVHQRCATWQPCALHASAPTTPMLAKPLAYALLPLALLIGAIQPQPVDASPYVPPAHAPLAAADLLRHEIPLTDRERLYFKQFGGSAARFSYGPYGLLLVSTASPLRHLHDPTICLSGMGYAVRLLGTDFATAATVYQATDQDDRVDGAAYQVRVSYLSADGELATSIAEVIWHWLRQPGTRWTMVQRIEPIHPGIDLREAQRWEQAMQRAFNIAPQTN